MLSSRAPATQNGDEGGAELAVEDGVDDRIERRVAVAEPEDDGEQAVWNVEVEQQRQRTDRYGTLYSRVNASLSNPNRLTQNSLFQRRYYQSQKDQAIQQKTRASRKNAEC